MKVRNTLPLLAFMCVSIPAPAQEGNFNDFDELELGGDDFSLEGAIGVTPGGEDKSGDMFGLDDLPDIPEAAEEDIDFGDDPAAKIPQQYELDLSENGLTPTPPTPSGKTTSPMKKPQVANPNPAMAAPPPTSTTVSAPQNALTEPAAAQLPVMPDNGVNLEQDSSVSNSFAKSVTKAATPAPTAAPVALAPVPSPVSASVSNPAPVAKPEPIAAPETPASPTTAIPPAVVGTGGAYEDGIVDVAGEDVDDDHSPVAPAITPMNDFSGVPYVPGTRRVMAAGEAPERYMVEEGDTLYDVCDQLLDEPDYWPKLWALNPGIKNPHFIFPGMQLSFYPGDETTPPYLEVVSEDDIVPLDTGSVDENDLVSADVGDLIVEDSQIPAVEVIQATKNDDFDDIEFQTEFETYGEKYNDNTITVDIPAFFFETETDVLGQVVSGPYGEINAKSGDKVVIEKFSELNLGSSFTIVRPSGFVTNEAGEDVGYRYEYVAQIQVLSTTDDGDYVIAAISRSRLGVQPKDQVVSYLSTIRSYTASDLVFADTPTDASVVGFEYPTGVMGSEGSMVFIDDAFSTGTTLPIFQRIDTRIKRMLGRSLPAISSRIGIIKIIDTVGSASLGVVIKSSLDVRVGDRLGSG